MKSLKLALLVVVMVAFLPLSLVAKGAAPVKQSVGEKLLHQLWSNMKKSDMPALEKMTAKGFQAIHQDGARDRAQEITLIKNLKLGVYTLSNIKITQSDNVIVATYFVSVAETIDKKRLSKKPAPRMTVFVKSGEVWKWIAHANLKPLK